ncbi:MAG TPA: S8 family serine peptidase [Tenuifilaceae bacterium]|nr:S8 family serine peptidase [Tenuifilaceae bacterium]
MNKLICTLLTIVFALPLTYSQDKYFVAFADKKGTPYSTDNPEAYLSQRSIERRNRQGIEIIERDLPVSPDYIEQVEQTGAKVLYPLKWFNGVVVEVYSQQMVEDIQSIDPVVAVEQIYKSGVKASQLPEDEFYPVYSKKSDPKDYYSYGSSATQVKMLNGHALHNLGYRGKGMRIAVLDAGFYHVNSLPAFDSLNAEGRIVLTRDFVNPNADIYQEHTHGMIVLSAMAGNIPGQLIGTAPEAEYVLIRTEDGSLEQIIEEYNWAAGAELADSLGVDVINSSLGYYAFDADYQNHTYDDMNGETTPASRVANFAAAVGMLVVSSAGNEGNNAWQHIITPSDGLFCLGVGAVDGNGNYVSFSSIGPSADGRVKPDVAAMGSRTVVQGTDGQIATANGTSLSAPIISGLAACLWQALKNETVNGIRYRIHYSSSCYNNPNNLIGYGIPNFFNAMYPLSVPVNNKMNQLKVFPNPSSGKITLSLPMQFQAEYSLCISSSFGEVVYSGKVTPQASLYSLNLPGGLASGIYLVKLSSKEDTMFGKIILQ